MNCFQLLATVLDEVWSQMPGNDAQKTDAVHAQEQYLHQHYANLLRVNQPVNYADPATRYAYLCCYVSSHANLVADLIRNNSELSDLFEAERVQVTCVGGGPGSDLLGVLKHLDRVGLTPALKVYLYDREQAWSESWSDVDDKVDKGISTYFEPFDVTAAATWQQKQKYLLSDLFTMVYFASELHWVAASAAPFFDNLFNRAKRGSLFLYVDNAHTTFFNWFDARYQGKGVSVLASADDATMRLPNEEEKRDLGAHYLRIQGDPKIRANVAYRVLRKD